MSKIRVGQIKEGAELKSEIVDNDMFTIVDSTDLTALKQIKAENLKDYFGEAGGGGLGLIHFEIEDGDLVMYYEGDVAPDFEIEDGDLVYNFTED